MKKKRNSFPFFPGVSVAGKRNSNPSSWKFVDDRTTCLRLLPIEQRSRTAAMTREINFSFFRLLNNGQTYTVSWTIHMSNFLGGSRGGKSFILIKPRLYVQILKFW